MSDYVRPPLPADVYRDDSGAVIDYGNRWAGRPGRLPPEDTYSVVTNPQRFAPLHRVADALIEHLVENYDITVNDDRSVAVDIARPGMDILRAVRLTPSNAASVPLTLGFTTFPGVIIHVGPLDAVYFPRCGCDACDDSIEECIAEVEEFVLAAVSIHAANRYGSEEDVEVADYPLDQLPIAYIRAVHIRAKAAELAEDARRQGVAYELQPWPEKAL